MRQHGRLLPRALERLNIKRGGCFCVSGRCRYGDRYFDIAAADICG